MSDSSYNATVKPTVAEYVMAHGGDHPITRALIANNGCAAVKCIRSNLSPKLDDCASIMSTMFSAKSRTHVRVRRYASMVL